MSFKRNAPGCCNCGSPYSIPSRTCTDCTVSASTLTATWYYAVDGSIPGPAINGPVETVLNSFDGGFGLTAWKSDVYQCPADSNYYVSTGGACYYYFIAAGCPFTFDVYTSSSPDGPFTSTRQITALQSCSPFVIHGIGSAFWTLRHGDVTL